MTVMTETRPVNFKSAAQIAAEVAEQLDAENPVLAGWDVYGLTTAYEERPPLREIVPVYYKHLRAHETRQDLVCRSLLEKKKKQ